MSDSDLERILNQFRQELLRKERAAASQMVRAYGKAWQRIQEELQRLDAEYEAIKAIGGRPSWEWIYEHNRLKAFRAQVERELEEELNGHPNCRCGMVPVLPGINFKVKPGTELFARLPAEKQIQVLGKKIWEHWKNGDFIFANLSKVRKNNVWGSMTVERSLKELLFEREQLISQIKKLKRDDVLRIGELDGILLEKMGVNITDNLSIVLTGERRLHYLENHAEMEPFEDLLINIISQPDFACPNKQDDDVMILYRKIDEARALRLVIRLQKGKTDYKHSIMSYRFSSLAEYEKDFLRKIYTP